MVTIAIHQPEYHPWLGFFKKYLKLMILFFNDVQYMSDRIYLNKILKFLKR